MLCGKKDTAAVREKLYVICLASGQWKVSYIKEKLCTFANYYWITKPHGEIPHHVGKKPFLVCQRHGLLDEVITWLCERVVPTRSEWNRPTLVNNVIVSVMLYLKHNCVFGRWLVAQRNVNIANSCKVMIKLLDVVKMPSVLIQGGILPYELRISPLCKIEDEDNFLWRCCVHFGLRNELFKCVSRYIGYLWFHCSIRIFIKRH